MVNINLCIRFENNPGEYGGLIPETEGEMEENLVVNCIIPAVKTYLSNIGKAYESDKSTKKNTLKKTDILMPKLVETTDKVNVLKSRKKGHGSK
jgi:glutamine synthetase type III